MNEETVTIILPLPSRLLSQNKGGFGSLGGRMAKAGETKRARLRAKVIALSHNIQTGPWEKTEVLATFYHSSNRRRDAWNSSAMLKPYIDGVVDAKIIKDDDYKHLTCLPVEFEIDKANPRVELKFTRKE